MSVTFYEVHWAQANRADVLVATRAHATRHLTRDAAEAEARTLSLPRPTVVPIVVEVRTHVAPARRAS